MKTNLIGVELEDVWAALGSRPELGALVGELVGWEGVQHLRYVVVVVGLQNEIIM